MLRLFGLQHKRILVITVLCLVAVLATVGQSRVSSMTRLDQMITSTVTIGTSISTSKVQPQQVLSRSFTVLATTGTNLPCEYWSYNFTASVGQYVYGNFTSDNPVGFFVVQQPTYVNWLKAGTCGNPGDAIASQLITTSYGFAPTAIPSSGTWTIVIINSSNSKNAEGYVTAYLSTVGYTLTQPLMTTTTTMIPTFAGQSPSIPGFPIGSIIIGIIAGLFGILLLRRRNRR